MNACRICSNIAEHKIWIAREMMFGLRDEFEYFECLSCGCLQISQYPDNLERYYPPGYYSFNHPKTYGNYKDVFIRSQIARYCLDKKNLVGKLLDEKYRLSEFFPPWLVGNKLGIKKKTSVLDVGCGAGHLLYEWKELLGLNDLTGLDPYIEQNIFYNNGVRIYKGNLDCLDRQYDVVMLHHSFEHMAEPKEVFCKLWRLLKRDGKLLIRIPIVPSYAWKKYRKNWVQLDAPRHLYLHSINSLTLLANSVGFRIDSIDYDSTAFQFWGSEQYQKEIPLLDECSYGVNIDKSSFSTQDMDDFARQANALNQRQEGDQACFYLYKP